MYVVTPISWPFFAHRLRSVLVLTIGPPVVPPPPLEPVTWPPPAWPPPTWPGTEPGAPGTLPFGVVPFGPTAAAPVGPPAAFETVVEPVGAPRTSIACTASTATSGA